MADPGWKTLQRAQADVVQLLSGLLSGPLLDKLQAKNLLTDENYESVRRRRKNDGDTEAARDVITLLKKTPKPAYDSFCQALREVDGGETVLSVLQANPVGEAVSNTTGVDVDSKKGIASGSHNPKWAESGLAFSRLQNTMINGVLPEAINESLIRVVATIAEAKWQKLVVFLERKTNAISQYKEKSDENLVRAMMVIEDWVAERGRGATVTALIQACEKCGIHRDNIEAAYKANVL
ncbi:uncharacterized protein [Oscarella lobularis]|uniref:uncharacterized protein isoform X2 n=1 Tax=Oscarella lobularis TaxID=121494 RepID=UPI00331374EF